MNLYIMRHAEAEDEAESGDDEARPLTVRGRERTRDAAGGLRALGVRFEAILTSPLLRAAETAGLVADEYANNPPPQSTLLSQRTRPRAKPSAKIARAHW